MPGLKLNHVSKRGHMCHLIFTFQIAFSLYQVIFISIFHKGCFDSSQIIRNGIIKEMSILIQFKFDIYFLEFKSTFEQIECAEQHNMYM